MRVFACKKSVFDRTDTIPTSQVVCPPDINAAIVSTLHMQILSNTATLGIQRGLDGIESGASKIASAEQQNSTEDRTIEALIEIEQGKQQSQASVKALSAENEVIGSLLSITA